MIMAAMNRFREIIGDVITALFVGFFATLIPMDIVVVVETWDQRQTRFVYRFSDLLWVVLWLAVSCLLLPFFRKQSVRQRDKNSYRSCGYCLTGNVSGICPECGMKLGADQIRR